MRPIEAGTMCANKKTGVDEWEFCNQVTLAPYKYVGEREKTLVQFYVRATHTLDGVDDDDDNAVDVDKGRWW